MFELLVYFWVKVSLGGVIVHRHKLQVEQLVIDLVLVKHPADCWSENNHHEETDAGGHQSFLILHHQLIFSLCARCLHKEEHIELLSIFWTTCKRFEGERCCATLSTNATFLKNCLEVFLAELFHLRGFHRMISFRVVIAVVYSVHVTAREGHVEHHSRGEYVCNDSGVLAHNWDIDRVSVLPVNGHLAANWTREAHVAEGGCRSRGNKFSKAIHSSKRHEDTHLEASADWKEKEEPEQILLKFEVVLDAWTVRDEGIVSSWLVWIGVLTLFKLFFFIVLASFIDTTF